MAATVAPEVGTGELMNAISAATYLGVSISTLRRLRLTDKYFPKTKKVCRRSFFRRSDLQEWLQRS